MDFPVWFAGSSAYRERYPASERYSHSRYDRGIYSGASHVRYPDRYLETFNVEEHGVAVKVMNFQCLRASFSAGQQHPSESGGHFVCSGPLILTLVEALSTICSSHFRTD